MLSRPGPGKTHMNTYGYKSFLSLFVVIDLLGLMVLAIVHPIPKTHSHFTDSTQTEHLVFKASSWVPADTSDTEPGPLHEAQEKEPEDSGTTPHAPYPEDPDCQSPDSLTKEADESGEGTEPERVSEDASDISEITDTTDTSDPSNTSDTTDTCDVSDTGASCDAIGTGDADCSSNTAETENKNQQQDPECHPDGYVESPLAGQETKALAIAI